MKARPSTFLTATAIALAMALSLLAQPACAVTPDEILADPAMEARARDISLGLRCVVCQNQSIDDSNAPLAKDLRILVRERLKAGDSNEQATNYIVSRYGNFVLLKPPFQLDTALLWFGPILLLALAGYALATTLKRQQRAPAPAQTSPLSKEDERRLARLMGEATEPSKD